MLNFSVESPAVQSRPQYNGQKNGHFVFEDMNIEFDILEKYEVKDIRKHASGDYYMDIVTKSGGKISLRITKTTDMEFERLVDPRGKRCVCKNVAKGDFRYAEYKKENWTSPGSCYNEVNLYVKAKNTLVITRYTEDAINSYYNDAIMMDDEYNGPYNPPNKAGVAVEGECSYFNYSLRTSIKNIE